LAKNSRVAFDWPKFWNLSINVMGPIGSYRVLSMGSYGSLSQRTPPRPPLSTINNDLPFVSSFTWATGIPLSSQSPKDMGHRICHVLHYAEETFYAVFALSELRYRTCFSRGDKHVEFKSFMFVLSGMLVWKINPFHWLICPILGQSKLTFYKFYKFTLIGHIFL
jgi:hypothetical protein